MWKRGVHNNGSAIYFFEERLAQMGLHYVGMMPRTTIFLNNIFQFSEATE